ncbi:DUF2232 domain-containing protein [Xanthobacter sp. V3C-3]|uniref:DUF2232 domain-containing protein n=1 Tax=Xanthobacter lutulentifluminis TaxID=3119935 RepID=UPI00372A3523
MASALLAASVAVGSVLGVPFFYLSPLPVMIAGIAFSPIAAIVSVATGGLALLLAFGGTFLVTYLVGIGGPAFGLSYAAMLARSDPAGRDGLVWFPVGGLVLMAAGFATVSVIVALFAVAGTYEGYRTAVTAAFEALISAQGLPPGAGVVEDPAAMGRLIAAILPAMAAVMTMVSQLVCLYLAGRAAMISGRFARPWPKLSAFRLPPATSLVLAVALALSMAGALLGLSASAATATILAAYALAGFAVVHAVTEGHSARTLILSALWVTAMVLGWPVLAMAALGFVDGVLDLRSRIARGNGPPAANDR